MDEARGNTMVREVVNSVQQKTRAIIYLVSLISKNLSKDWMERSGTPDPKPTRYLTPGARTVVPT